MRMAFGQFDAVVGDLAGNVDRMQAMWQQAQGKQVDLLVFPELSLCGYPPEDLLYKTQFLSDTYQALQSLAEKCPKGTLIVGLAEGTVKETYNAAVVIREGQIGPVYRKGRLPNFSVFDEARYFKAGQDPLVIEVQGIRVALSICFDLWYLPWLAQWLAPVGQFDLLLNISASPFDVGKLARRERVMGQAANHFDCAVGYCNLVGGQDELVFDGRSMVTDQAGRIVARARAFETDLLITDISCPDGQITVQSEKEPADACSAKLEEVYRALVLGTRDYFHKNGFNKGLLGVSGGIDSAVTAAIAVAAIGAENVISVTMPSHFNSPETIADARILAENLNIELHTLPISQILKQFNHELARVDGWHDQGLAYENLQARIRGTLLMSMSNQFGALVLTTGNKSETSVGYSTLYGDTAGGFAVIKDVPKTLVYELAYYINEQAGHEVIPTATIVRPPSAELRPDQKDSDSLPDYELLDQIITGYVEQDKSAADLIAQGLPEAEVRRVIRLIDLNEYKRRQSPPGVRITSKAFGKDRRLPITNQYRHK
ncbi:MAG: NAD+ synthase [Phycisphaerae bacterium]|nr:NAD+ synthase [Phycisphaerae bacterium]